MIDEDKMNESYDLKVLSYNVLADAYTKGKMNLGHYKNNDLKVLQDHEYRATRVIREIQ